MVPRSYRTPLIVTALGLVGILFYATFRPSPQIAEAAGQAPKADGPVSAEEKAIRQTTNDYLGAIAKGELDGVMAYWAPDADYIDEAGATTRGKEQIAALYAKVLPERKGKKLAVKIHGIKFLRPEVALEDSTLEVTDVDGTKEAGRYASVWVKTGDKWLISSVRDLPTENIDLPSLAAARLKDLSWLIGEWVDNSDKVDVLVNCRWDTNKAFLLMDYSVKRDGVEPLAVSVRIGWDGASGRIRSWTFDSQGGFGEGFWQKDGKKWLVGTTGVLPDGGTGGASLTYEFVDENTFVWRATDRDVDGLPLADAEVKFTRKPAKK